MVKISVEISNPELDAIEDLAVAWNLCKKHNASWKASEDDRWRFTQTCKKCMRINKKLRSKVLHAWSKLVTAYEKTRKHGRRRDHKKKQDAGRAAQG